MMIMLFGGYDTISHLISTVLYCLQNNSGQYTKLMESLKANGITDLDPESGPKLKDLYENSDYLNYVIREALRFDPPAQGTLPYYAVEDVTICGVPISKGTIVRPSINFPHYNKNQWPNPTEFIPERFDPESEFYVKPNPKSFIPFSFGIRN